MAFDFSKIIAEETKKQEQANQGGSGIGYKTLYPFANGRLELKFIGNEPSGLLYREIVYHEYYVDNKKYQVPCLHQMYGIDCPICNMVQAVQDKIDDKNVWRKYGYKQRGIMFAKLLNITPDNYFGDNKNPAKQGDIVIFMFPKSAMAELRKLIIEYGDEIGTLFTENTTRNVTLKVETQANGFPAYTFFVKNNTSSLCVDDNGNLDDVAFAEFMKNMPNLKEVKFPSAPTEEMMTAQKAVCEEMSRLYFGNVNVSQQFENAAPTNVANTTAAPANSTIAPNAPVQTDNQTINTASANTASESVNTTTSEDPRGSKPPCWGNNQYNEVCAACPWDAECI